MWTVEHDDRSPAIQGGNESHGSDADAARSPGKTSLTEAYGADAGAESASTPAHALGDAKHHHHHQKSDQVFGTDAPAKRAPPQGKPLPRIELRDKKHAAPAKPGHAAHAPAVTAGPAAAGPAAAGPTAAPAAAPHAEAAAPPAHAAPVAAPKHGGEGKPGAGGGAQGAQAAPADPKANAHIKIEVSRPAAGNANKGRTSVGVGEDVTFTSTTDGEWSASGGTIGSGSASATSWKAPETPGSVEIGLKTKGATEKQTMQVLAPTGVEFKSKGGFPVKPAGVGMTTQVNVLPNTVSFGACEWLEQPGPADGASGYFATYVSAGKGDLAHHPNANWLGMGDANNSVEDHAWTSDNPRLVDPSKNEVGYFAGGFGWNIPNKYRVAGKGDGAVFTTVRQQFAMTDDGSVNVQKGAASATQAGDGKVLGTTEKCTTVGQAHTMLNRQGSRVAAVMFVLQYNASNDRDPETAKNLIAALREEDIKFYVHFHCVTTYNNFSRDELSVKIKGIKAAHDDKFLINNKKNHETTFSLEELIDYNGTQWSAIIIHADNDGGESFSTVMNDLEALNEVEAGSSGHYQISAHVQ
jgi:hypothetical protein